MREMKDSGVEWIGKIPRNWTVVPLAVLTDDDKYSMVDGPFGSDLKNEEYVDSGIPIVQLTNIRSMYHNTSILKYVTEEKAESLIRHNAKAGDLVIAKMMPAGRTCILSDISKKYVICADVIKVSIADMYIKRFVAYCMNAYGVVAAELLSTGSTRVRISLGIAKKTKIAFPADDMIKKIVNYLDKKCAKIDSVIEKQQAIIEKLKEYKLSIITEAVTKGINPDVEMKDSGIYYIGEVPKHYDVYKFKHIVKKKIDNRGRTPDLLGNNKGIPVVEVASLGERTPDLSKVKKYISQESHDKFIRDDVEKGDILVTTVGATIGKCSIVDNPDFCIAQNLVGYRVNDKQESIFWYYYFQSKVFQDMFSQYDKGNTINNVKISNMEQGYVVIAPKEEQQAIVTHLDNICERLKLTIIQRTELIERLQAYKKSLIYEVVTGKKEV